jgi:bacillithiol synthase
LNLDIRVGVIGGDPLVEHHVTGDPRAAPFFSGSPFDTGTYPPRADEVRARFAPDSLQAMATAVRPLGDGAAGKLSAIVRGEGFFVTTGQQPGLFGGPLYTVYKALTAMALATRLEDVLGVPVLALFWVASDDHDWEEANHVHVLDTANALHRLVLAGPDQPPASMGRRLVGAGIESTLGELSQILPPSDFATPLLDHLRHAYKPESSVAGAFRETVARLFDGWDLALVDGQDPAVRGLAAPILAQALEQAESGLDPVADQTARLTAAGYEAQVPVLPGASGVFHEDGEYGRERLQRAGDGWQLRASGRRFSAGEVRSLLASQPERFSPNVTLRPVVESAVFPTLAYVGGPGEVRYLAQTRSLFEAHGVGMPVVFPRLGVLLIEGKVSKVLTRFGLDAGSFGRPVHEVIAAVVREDVPSAVQEALAGMRESIRAGYEVLGEAARPVDPTLKGPIQHARNESFRALSEVEKKIRHHVKARHQTELEQIEKAAVNLAPLGKPQERVLNIHQYVARYGVELLGAVRSGMEAVLASRLRATSAPLPAGSAPDATGGGSP